MMPHNIYVQGSYIDIHDCETVNLSCNGAEVHVDKQPQPLPTSPHETEPAIGNPDASLSAEDDDIDIHLNHLTDEQVKASGIRCQPRVALALMRAMQPACVQKVDWLSFYSVLLNRGWMDANVRAFARMVAQLFGVEMDPRTLASDLAKQGSADYTRWTDADRRIVRRKQLATEFDTRLTAYFERKRSAVLQQVKCKE